MIKCSRYGFLKKITSIMMLLILAFLVGCEKNPEFILVCDGDSLLVDDKCHKEVYVQQVDINYYCDNGGYLVDDKCKSISTMMPTTNYSCAAGYTLSGTTCTKTTNTIATYTTVCPYGYEVYLGRCKKTTYYPAEVVYYCFTGVLSGTRCISSFTVPALKSGNMYYCSDRTCSLSGTTCICSTTLSASRKYVCTRGVMLSYANQCYEDDFEDPIDTYYKCPDGYTVSGASCTKKEQVNAYANLTCSNGYYLDSDGICKKEIYTDADFEFSCPDGLIMDNHECYKIEITEPEKVEY